jgi:O-antigen/teichoic acid export membrane protein
MGLMGSSIGGAADILRILSWVVLARALTTAMSPMIVVAGRQGKSLWLTGASVLLEALAFWILIPRFGIKGAAVGYLFIELIVGVVPVSWIGQYVSKTTMAWTAPVKLILCAGGSVGICGMLPGAGSIWSGMLSVALYVPMTVLVGAISLRQLRSLARELHRPGGRETASPAVMLRRNET